MTPVLQLFTRAKKNKKIKAPKSCKKKTVELPKMIK